MLKSLYGPNVTDVIHSETVKPCHFPTYQDAKRLLRLPPSSQLQTAAIFSHLIELLSIKVNGHPPATTIIISDDDAHVFVHPRDTTATLYII